MAIADRYRNRLTTAKKNNALQTNTTGLQSGLQNNTTNIQNNSQNELNNDYNPLDYLENEGNSYKSNLDTNSYGLKDIQSLISAKTANPKMELQSALQRAQSASNEYLKALGLQGSGMGQSQLTDIGVQYQNALSKINQNATTEVNEQLDKSFKSMVDSGGYSSRQLQDYINKYGEQTGKSDEWNSYAEASGNSYSNDVTNIFNELQEIIDGDTYELSDKSTVNLTATDKTRARLLKDQLNNAYLNGDKDEFYRILDKNSRFLNNLEMSTDTNSNSNNNSTNSNTPAKYSAISKSTLLNGNYFQLFKNPNEWFKVGGEDTYIYYDRNNNGRVTVIKNGETKTFVETNDALEYIKNN